MIWLESLPHLTQTRTPFVMVTLLSVRGHAPREAGAKMLVTEEKVFDTIGGGNLEQTAIALALDLLANTITQPQQHTLRLTEKEESQYGIQCCGGEVTLLLEPVLTLRPTVAIFGVGHVGLALAKILSLLPIELWLVDSREEMLQEARLRCLQTEAARLHVQHLPLLDTIVQDLPKGSHLVIMTHDHAEDLFVLEMALKREDLGFIGLIGSDAKWSNFKRNLLGQGFHDKDLERVTTPIGLPDISSKRPEMIAVATAAQIAMWLERDELCKYDKLPTQHSKGL
ncbi:MAG: xanthine dehydrogenase accessory protein XdhC [Trueperaceae bacterium]